MDELETSVAEQPKISCNLEQDFKPKICRPEKTAILFLGTETKDPDNILNALSELQDDIDLDLGVLDLASPDCEDLTVKYKIDKEATQLVVFQNCEKIYGISLESGDLKGQIAKLKASLEAKGEEEKK